MTLRESLEAAGWIRTPLYQGRWTDPVTKISCSEAAAILTQLARDEVKETSDGRDERLASAGNDDRQRNSGILSGSNRDGSDTSAPVATSVSAPDLARAKEWWANNSHRLINADNWWDMEQCLAEYASSSSAALLAANEVIRRQLKKVCDQAEAAAEYWQRIFADMAAGRARDIEQFTVRAEAAEAKVIHWKLMADNLRDSRDRLQGQAAELRGQLEVRETLAAADLEKLKELEDNSAQDEREIEALQESLRTVRQDLADRDGIIIGLQDVAAGKTRPLTDIEAELRGNKS